jgi:hypothetical protein
MLALLVGYMAACKPDSPKKPLAEELVLPVRAGEIVLLGEYGSDVCTAWALPRKEILALPRWTPGQATPLTYEDALRVVNESGQLPKDARLRRISFQALNDQKQLSGVDDVFFYVIDYIIASRDHGKNYRSFVVLPDGRLLESRQTKPKDNYAEQGADGKTPEAPQSPH